MDLKSGFLLLFICTGFVVLLITTLESTLEKKETKTVFIEYYPSSQTDNKLMNLTDFRYIIKPECNASFLVWIVTSYAGDPSARSALRRAYPTETLEKLGIKRIFLLGTLNQNHHHKTYVSQNALLHESNRFNDILQGNFMEAYKNLTYKHLMGLKWAVDNCRNVNYIMKMDDDIVIDLHGIITKLQENSIDKNAIAGYVMRNMIPVREPANKWFVTRDEFAANVYPDFLSGWLYITKLSTARKLVNYGTSYQKYFWIDDVLITGIWRENLNIKTQNINQLYATDYRYLNCCIKGKGKRLKCDLMVGPNGGDPELQIRFKDFVEFCSIKCSKRPKQLSVINSCVAPYEEMNLGRGNAQIHPIKILR